MSKNSINTDRHQNAVQSSSQMIGCSQRSIKTEWKWYSNQRLKALKVRSAGMLSKPETTHPVVLQRSPCSDFVDAGAPLLTCRTREAGRLLLRPSDRSVRCALVGSASCSQSKNGWAGITTTADRLIVFISYPPLRLPAGSNNSASHPNAPAAGLRHPPFLCAGGND